LATAKAKQQGSTMGIYQRKQSPYWYYRFVYGGVLHRGTTGETDRRAAQKTERRIRAEIEARTPNLSSRTIGMAEVGTLDITRAINEKNSAREVLSLRGRWKSMIAILGPNMRPSKLTPADIQRLTNELRQTKRTQTVRKHLTALKRGLALAVDEGWLHTVPTKWPRLKSDPPKLEQAGKLHPPEAIATWLRELPDDARDEASIVLLTGLRWGEVKRLKWSWVKLAPQGSPCRYLLQVPAEGAKTRTARMIPLPTAAFEILRGRRVPDDGPIFGGVKDHKTCYRAAARRSGYDKRITLRDLRHFYATHADWLAGDRRSAQELLGHTSEQMTANYLHSTSERLGKVAHTVGEWIETRILPKVITGGDHTKVNHE
jgi:integrase